MDQPETQTAPNYVTCPCQYCSGKIEFDANQLDAAENTTAPCPHCGLETIIFVPEQKVPPVISDESFHLREIRRVEREVKQLSQPPASSSRIGEDEEIIQQCIEVIRSEQKASVSLLHQRLHLDYVRAARIMDELEERGIVGAGGAERRIIMADLNSGGYLRGDARWQTDLGIAYFRQKNYNEAVICFAKAAEKGNAAAQYVLGLCYMNGNGVTQDDVEAVKWFLKAAAQKNENAEFGLGLAYQAGLGVPENHSEAMKWWQEAAKHGHRIAHIKLYEAYETGDDFIAAYNWAKRAAALGIEGAQKKCEELVLKMDAEQIGAVEPADQMLWKRECLTPKRFSEFIGQNRIKARLELATTAAKKRFEPLGHVLLVGKPGSGKATLANILAREMGANLKSASGTAIENAGDLAGLLTNLEEGDVLFIDEIYRLQKTIAEYLPLAAKNFKLDIILDQGPNARQVRLNLPRFTLIATAPRPERVMRDLLSCFSIIENMDGYNVEELAYIARRFALPLNIELDVHAAHRIASSADGTPIDVFNRLQHVRDFAHVKGEEKITLEVAEAALKMLASSDEVQDARENRDAIPSEIRREVWRRDGGKCVKCSSRKNLEYDHIIPVSQGGSNTVRNIELLCEACNRAKSDLIQ